MGSLLRSIVRYLFEPRFHFNRIQFNIIALFFVTAGIFIGIYSIVSHIFDSSIAFNDTLQVWTFNTDNIAEFTYDTNYVGIDDNGAFPGVNRLTNASFEGSLSGWTTIQSYLVNDEFTTALPAGSVNGSSAEPGPGTRSVNDVENIISTTGGELILGAQATPAHAEESLVLNTGISRQIGRVLFGKFMLLPGSHDLGPLYFTNSLIPNVAGDSSLGHYMRIGGNGLSIRSGGMGAVNSSVGSITTGVYYQLAAVLRTRGVYWLIKGGTEYPNWTLLWQDTYDTDILLYPGTAYSYSGSMKSDYIRVPETLWTPYVLAYDTFARADGSLGNTEINGPDSKSVQSLAWSGSTWSINGGIVKNTPNYGSEILTNGNFEDGNPPTGWYTINGTPVTFEQTSSLYYEGSYSCHLLTDAVNEGMAHSVPSVTNNWYMTTGYFYSTNQGTYLTFNVGYGEHYLYLPLNQWNKLTTVNRASNSRIQTIGYPGDYYYDNVSVKAVPTSELFATVDAGESDVIVEAGVSLQSLTYNRAPAGVVARLNDPDNPTDFLLAYIDGGGANNWGTFYLFQVVDNTYTTLIATDLNTKGTSYSAGGKIKLILSGANIYAYYKDIYMGSAVSNEQNIINNTRHGLFSTVPGNTFSNFAMWPRGTGGEFQDIPAEEITATIDTGVKLSGSYSAKLVTPINDANFLQSINVGTTDTYNVVAYAYIDETTPVDTDSISLYWDNSVISTTYSHYSGGTEGVGGWYKLMGSFTGSNSNKKFGFRLLANKTVYIDDVKLYRTGSYLIYTSTITSEQVITSWDIFCEGILSGLTCENTALHEAPSTIRYQFCPNDGAVCTSASSWQFWNGEEWITATNLTTDTNLPSEVTLAAMAAIPTANNKLSVRAIFTFDDTYTPYLKDLSVAYTTDVTPPDVQASSMIFKRNYDALQEYENNESDPVLTKENTPYFYWDAASDDINGSGMKGYCIYMGQEADAAPNQASNLLNTTASPLSTLGTNPLCRFIVEEEEIDFSVANITYRGDPWLESSTSPYYLKVWAVDNSGNVQTNDPAVLTFLYDGTGPVNVAYISTPSGNFSNVLDMSFSWPITGSAISYDEHSELLGWQYQINSTAGEWRGIQTEPIYGFKYLPLTLASYNLTEADRDAVGVNRIIIGNNIIFFRSVDIAGNPSPDATIRTGNLSFGGDAPFFNDTDRVTVDPSLSETNIFALSWPEATPSMDNNVAGYYYMINTLPPSSYDTLINNPTTYIYAGLNTSVSARSLPNVNKMTNVVYVVAIDDAEIPNYSPSNYIFGEFMLNSTNPDNVNDLVVSDSSIKLQAKWNVTLTWTEPVYQGAGNLTYLIYRSSDGVNFSEVGTTSGLSYVDNTPESRLYYYKIYTRDGADALSSGTNALSIIPTGKWTVPAELESGPEVSDITTRKATIKWSTKRTSDSKVAFGVESGIYYEEETGNSSQVTSHEIDLTNLDPATVYYYVVKWTDEDGNTGISEEDTFTTAQPPTVSRVSVSGINLSSAIVTFTVKDTSMIRVYYGTTTSFGGVMEMSTSMGSNTYSMQLTGLIDGTRYYYKINRYDSEGAEYQGDIYNFTTLPRPKITSVRVEGVNNTAETTIKVTWTTNTEVSSIVTYYPEGEVGQARDEVKITLEKGTHMMIIRGLLPQTRYILIVKGRDRIGNEAESDTQLFTTATDTRPPEIYNLKVVGGISSNDGKAQLIVTWDSDELATSQVEFGLGSGNTYSQKSQADSNLTRNHTVIISGLISSQVYHLRAVSADSANNVTYSMDTATIAPKENKSAFDLVVKNLLDIFGISM